MRRRNLKLILNQTIQRDFVRLIDITEDDEIPSQGLYINDLVYAPDVMPPLPLSLELVVTQHQHECGRPCCSAALQSGASGNAGVVAESGTAQKNAKKCIGHFIGLTALTRAQIEWSRVGITLLNILVYEQD